MEASSSGTKAVEDVLKEFRLGVFLPKLLDLGVECIKDLADLKGDDLKELGFSKIQRNRFRDMASKYGFDLQEDMDTDDSSLSSSSTSQPSILIPLQQGVSSSSRFMEKSIFNVGCSDYILFYQTQHHVLIGATEKLASLNPYKLTLKDLVEIIVRRENFDTNEHSAELYTSDGTPLTNDSYLAAYCSLSTRCIESKSTICAVICKKERQPTVCDDLSDTSSDEDESDTDDEDQPDASTDAQSVPTTDAQSDPSTDAQPEKSTGAQPEKSSDAQPKKSSDAQPAKSYYTLPSTSSSKAKPPKRTKRRLKDVVNCCLVTGEHHKILVDLEENTPKDVKTKLSEITRIPESVLILKVQKVESFRLDESATLAKNDLHTNDWLNVYLIQPHELDSAEWEDNFTCEIQPYVEQTEKGMSMFAAVLYVAASRILEEEEIGVKLIGAIRRLTGLSPLVTALYLLSKRQTLSCAHKVAIVEGLYLLFRRLLPMEQELEIPDANKTTPNKAKLGETTPSETITPAKTTPSKTTPMETTPAKPKPVIERPVTRSQRKRQLEEELGASETSPEAPPSKSPRQADASDQVQRGSTWLDKDESETEEIEENSGDGDDGDDHGGDSVLLDSLVTKLIIKQGMRDQVQWIQDGLLSTATDREEDDDDQAMPLVSLTDESGQALTNKVFKQFLTKVGIVPPSSHEEMFWRIPGTLSIDDLRSTADSIKQSMENQTQNAEREQTNPSKRSRLMSDDEDSDDGQGDVEQQEDQFISDDRVFEHSNLCWMYLLKMTKSSDVESEKYKEVQLKCAGSNQTLIEPVTVASIPGKCFSRSYVLNCIEEKKEVDGKLILDPLSMSQDFEMQKILLSFSNMSGLGILGYISYSCYIWNRQSEVETKKPDCVTVMNIKKFRKEKKDERFAKAFRLCQPLYLDSYSGDELLTVNENHQYVVYTGITKAVGCPMKLYNPATRKTEREDKHKLAMKLKDFDFDQGTEWATIVREPKEAIIVLMDVSGSMASACFGSDMTRLVAAKELFFAFAERSMAYSLQHSIGLTAFSDKIRVVLDCNEYYESFKKKLEYVRITGGTALYDAICNAADQLERIKKTHPKCKRRIICLTDGIDRHSTKTPVEAVRRLESIDCVLDAVQITSFADRYHENTKILKSIAFATGGCCFQPESLPEGRKVFEMETVLSIRTRKLEPKPKPAKRPKIEPKVEGLHGFFCNCGAATAEELELQRLADLPWSTEPPCNKPDALTKPVARTHSVLVKASTETKKHTTKDRSKRLLREMAAIQREPHPAFSIYPSETNFDFWKILMVGPTDTPYESGVFSLYAEFPKNYPDAPPTIRFLTPIYHCNINSIGRICHGIFDRNYTSDTNVKTILSCVFGLLMTPEPRDPLDGVLAEEYFTSRDLYNQKAKEWTKIHASTSLKDCEQEMLDSSTLPKRKPPQHLVCPLTKQLLVDPVQTPYGHVYERHAIEAAINKVPCDPEAEEPLSKAELTPAITVRRQATDFRESQAKVAACWLN